MGIGLLELVEDIVDADTLDMLDAAGLGGGWFSGEHVSSNILTMSSVSLIDSASSDILSG